MIQQLFTSAGQVLVLALLIGAGLPTLFAVGIKAMSYGSGGDAAVDQGSSHVSGKILGITCFAVVLGAIALGITIVVASGFGMAVSFHNLLPVIVPKG